MDNPASEKLEALRAPWAEACDAWNAAAAAWQTLVGPNRLRSVERCPLPSPESVFGVVDRFAPEGTPIVYEPVDRGDPRSPITVAAGSAMHDALRTDRSWRAVRAEAQGAVPAARPLGVEPAETEAATA